MQKTKLNSVLLALFAILLFASCDSTRVYEEFVDLEDGGWNVENKPTFQVEITDTSSAYNLIFHVRNHKDYAYRNVWVKVQTLYPDGSISADSMNLYLSDETGRDLGKCSSGTCENAFVMNKKGPVKFPYNGKYEFKFEHLMRTDDQVLHYINNIGLRVETTAAKK